VSQWASPFLHTDRLVLEPLMVSAAREMVHVLAAPRLYDHTGGGPPDLQTLRERYARQAEGWSSDRSQRWFNWIVRRRETHLAVGYVQASLTVDTGIADVAWVIGEDFQRQGYATEAARAMLRWLGAHGDVERITAHISAENYPSQAVARHLGFLATSTVEHAEVVWEVLLAAEQLHRHITRDPSHPNGHITRSGPVVYVPVRPVQPQVLVAAQEVTFQLV
jgi:RimJ/RimL family protein N-acetyltransferase